MGEATGDYFEELDDAMPIRVVILRGTPDDEQFERLLARMAERVRADAARGWRGATLVDMSGAGMLSTAQRTAAVRWLREHDGAMRSSRVATAYVTPSTTLRLMLAAIFWFRTPTGPYALFSSRVEGLSWLADELERAGIEAPRDRLVELAS